MIDWVMRAQGVSFRHAVELFRAGEIPVVSGARRSNVRRLPTPVTTDADDAGALAQVVDFYHRTLVGSPEALAYLAARRIDGNDVVERFSLGYANRTLGLRLPHRQTKTGAALRGQLARLGVYRTSGHEHLAGSVVVPVIDARAPSPTSTAGRSPRTCGRAHRSTSTCPDPTGGCGTRRGSSVAR